ncbi:MAG TPA: SAF domain-containing protein, partial [Candidatus Nanoarchaeia archaeon]|nr:SAF domain-containing protein [Candidatus Nanoarchaeia archaeon]
EIIGNGKIELTPEQIASLRFVRRFIFAIADINEGDSFTEKNIATLRPGHRDIQYGIQPREYETIIGKKAIRHIHNGSLLTHHCVEGRI